MFLPSDAPPAGDWRAHNLGQKHTMSVMRDTEKKDESLPFGWTGMWCSATIEKEYIYRYIILEIYLTGIVAVVGFLLTYR